MVLNEKDLNPTVKLNLGHIGHNIDKELLNIMAGEILKPTGLICILNETLPGVKKVNLKITDIEINNSQVTLSAKRIGMVLMNGHSIHALTPVNIPNLAMEAFLKFTLSDGCKLSIIIPKEEAAVSKVSIKEVVYCQSKGDYIHVNKPNLYLWTER